MTAVHPAEELLAAYLQDDLDTDEQIDIETHLRECDLCISGLSRMQPHLAAAGMMAVRLPTTLRVPITGSHPAPIGRSASRRLRPPLLLRWPVLVPSSLAAGFLLAVSISAVSRPAPQGMTRAIEAGPPTAVAAAGSPLRVIPLEDAEVVGQLSEGERVTVIERDSGWARIQRAGGDQGWVRSANLR